MDLLQHRIARRRFPHGDERVQLLADLIQPCVAGLPIDPGLERRHPLAQPGFDVAHAPFDAAQGLEQHAVVGRGPRHRRPDRLDLLADRLKDPSILRLDRAPTFGNALCLLRQVLQRRRHADGHVRDPQAQRVAAALGPFLLPAHEHLEVAPDLCRRVVEQRAEVIEARVDLRRDALGSRRVERRHFPAGKLLERGLQRYPDVAEGRTLVGDGRDLGAQTFERHKRFAHFGETPRQ